MKITIANKIKCVADRICKIALPVFDIIDPQTHNKEPGDLKLELLSKEDAEELVKDFNSGKTIELPYNKVPVINKDSIITNPMFNYYINNFLLHPKGSPNPKMRYDKKFKRVVVI